MIVKNDYQLGLSNGQIGMKVDDYVYFETASGYRKIRSVLLGAYELAYAMSVHKSQGSEFEEVVLILPKGSERFGRKMLYTAVTRAKKSLRIYTTASILTATVTNDQKRNVDFFTR